MSFGTLLICYILLRIGLWFYKKSEPSEPTEQKTEQEKDKLNQPPY